MSIFCCCYPEYGYYYFVDLIEINIKSQLQYFFNELYIHFYFGDLNFFKLMMGKLKAMELYGCFSYNSLFFGLLHS